MLYERCFGFIVCWGSRDESVYEGGSEVLESYAVVGGKRLCFL